MSVEKNLQQESSLESSNTSSSIEIPNTSQDTTNIIEYNPYEKMVLMTFNVYNTQIIYTLTDALRSTQIESTTVIRLESLFKAFGLIDAKNISDEFGENKDNLTFDRIKELIQNFDIESYQGYESLILEMITNYIKPDNETLEELVKKSFDNCNKEKLNSEIKKRLKQLMDELKEMINN